MTTLNEFVIIKRREKMTDKGLYIPESSQLKQTLGDVVSVGNEVTKIKEGDVIAYNPDTEQLLDVLDGRLFLVHIQNVVGIV